ncbi:MAG: hypothetical protein U9R79_16895 [Armatimonadota bacterium]|nr:hypothetical protein [Armatimonadota bacterium]
MAGIEAIAAAATVGLMAWYTIAQQSELITRMQAYDESGVGVITIVAVLAAGGLLSFAFEKAEEAAEAWRHPSGKRGADD